MTSAPGGSASDSAPSADDQVPPGHPPGASQGPQPTIQAEPVEPFELGRVPDGFEPDGEAIEAHDEFTIRYAPRGGDGSFDGRRLSLAVTPPAGHGPTTGYTVVDTTTVRGGKAAAFFVVSDRSDDPNARRALTWQETPRSRITIYAFETELSFFTGLAESVRRRGN